MEEQKESADTIPEKVRKQDTYRSAFLLNQKHKKQHSVGENGILKSNRSIRSDPFSSLNEGYNGLPKIIDDFGSSLDQSGMYDNPSND